MFVVRSTGEWCHGVGLVVVGKGTVVVREGGRFLRVAVRGGGALPSVRSAGYREMPGSLATRMSSMGDVVQGESRVSGGRWCVWSGIEKGWLVGNEVRMRIWAEVSERRVEYGRRGRSGMRRKVHVGVDEVAADMMAHFSALVTELLSARGCAIDDPVHRVAYGPFVAPKSSSGCCVDGCLGRCTWYEMALVGTFSGVAKRCVNAWKSWARRSMIGVGSPRWASDASISREALEACDREGIGCLSRRAETSAGNEPRDSLEWSVGWVLCVHVHAW